MPMSDYIRDLRARIGTTVLEVPTVSVLTFDERDRVLLVRHVEGDNWTSPGGMIEPYETPANAAVREMWEETGLHVALTRVIGVFGGNLCAATYGNGDKVAWGSTVGGALLDRVSQNDLASPLGAFGRFYVGSERAGRFILSGGFQRVDQVRDAIAVHERLDLFHDAVS